MINVVLTGFISSEVTVESSDSGMNSRVAHMYDSVEQFFGFASKVRLFLVLTGDERMCTDFFTLIKKKSPPDLSVFLSYFTQLDEDISRGKGWLEVRLLRKFFAENALQSELFLKVSSKYIVENIGDVLLFCENATCSVAWKHLGKKMVDTRVIVLTPNALEFVSMNRVNDDAGYYLEHAMHEFIQAHGRGLIFFDRPIIKGLSGSTGEFSEMSRLKKMAIKLTTSGLKIFKNL
jgi:hypothetical protein